MSTRSFEDVTSLLEAGKLAMTGVLEPLHLLPVEFGGADHAQNRLYVPKGFAAVKRDHDLNVIMPLIQQGKVQEYEAIPEYGGKSIIPTAINIRAWGTTEVKRRIEIWGTGLVENN